ncbi:MAG: HNH endonuclease [candidate division WOR-3 bacterium]|nr:HNH endonuclease [candidate division WOR-3 bacterium]MCX7947570.1 HNH endonuclease [candidate division WOR-3 bacterium]MDW8150455.1 HNH endonuclease [candidate division WOR-3 bacterium]
MSRVLVLNQTFEPLNIISIKRAIKLIFTLKADIIYANSKLIRAQSIAIPEPSVIRLKYYIKVKYKEPSLSKKNIILRDRRTCQYCGTQKGPFTVDHITPKSRGGKDTWENLVCACMKCNLKKGDMLPEEVGMKLISKPRKPTYFELNILRDSIPDERWKEFLYLK